MNCATPSVRQLMNLGRMSSAALSGLAGVVAPMTVASALDLLATSGRAIAEIRSGLGVPMQRSEPGRF
jgi:hypothetical protein